jgi:hypothetical protein
MDLKRLVLFLASIIIGCSVPIVKVPKEKECEFKCQNELKDCNARCYEGYYSDSVVYVCVKQCNKEFSDCDQRCQNEESAYSQ